MTDTVFVAGATGATGRLLMHRLLADGLRVRTVVRDRTLLPDEVRDHRNADIVEAALLDLDDAALGERVAGCRAVASCLGHNLTLRGIFGPPRRLVRDATRRLCDAVRAHGGPAPVRFVLMNSAGCVDRAAGERVSSAERVVLALLRILIPPHADNEQAAAYLRDAIGGGDSDIESVIVRPDGLFDSDAGSDFHAHAAPTRSAIFAPGRTSRLDVARFMHRLMVDDALWEQWKGRSPVVYSADTPGG